MLNKTASSSSWIFEKYDEHEGRQLPAALLAESLFLSLHKHTRCLGVRLTHPMPPVIFPASPHIIVASIHRALHLLWWLVAHALLLWWWCWWFWVRRLYLFIWHWFLHWGFFNIWLIPLWLFWPTLHGNQPHFYVFLCFVIALFSNIE